MRQLQRIMQGIVLFTLCGALLCGNAFADVEEYTSPFPDVPTDAEYTLPVITLYEMGIFSGDEQGNFNPNKTISRAEAAAVICRMLGVEDEARQINTAVFTDVPSSHWAVGYVAKTAELGIVNGYGTGKFGPGDTVTYRQMVKMLICAAGFGDEAESAGGWPNGYIEVAKDKGIVVGTSANQDGGIPRYQVAMLVFNTIINE